MHLAEIRGMDVTFLVTIPSDQQRIRQVDLETPFEPDEEVAIVELKTALDPFLSKTNDITQPASVELPPTEKATSIVQTEGEQTKESNEGNAPAKPSISVKAIHYDDTAWVRKTLSAQVEEMQAELYTAVRTQMLGKNKQDYVIERARFYEFLPCRLLFAKGLTNNKTSIGSSFLKEQEAISKQRCAWPAIWLTTMKPSPPSM